MYWFVFIFLCFLAIAAKGQYLFVKAEVHTGNEGMKLFRLYDAFPESGFLKKDGTFTGEFKESNLNRLIDAGVKYKILNDNLQIPAEASTSKAVNYHSCFNRAKQYPPVQGAGFGTMGGFYTLDEALAETDTMLNEYPGIIGVKTQIGTSYQGRPIYALKISDNPGIQENEPRVLYTSIHHSQEPASLQQLIYFMYYLLENYGADPEVTYLIDNTELYFIPVVNPDGYEYNRTQNPGGGGLHRKNRHTTTFSDGVDLNRNYGYEFGYDELGSSSIGFHPWHRGDYAFSEPESYAVKNFIENNNIRIQINWHSYGNLIIYPWNYANGYTNDAPLYCELSRTMSWQNNYISGTVFETYGYQSNGDADDWSYGDTIAKPKCISLTAETGSMDDGFWPAQSRIFDLCREAIWTNLAIAHHAHSFYRMDDFTSHLIPLNAGYFSYRFMSTGIDTPATFYLTFVPITSNITFPLPDKQYTNMAVMETKMDSVYYTLSATNNEPVSFVVQINNGLYTFTDTINKTAADLTFLTNDNCETMQNWQGDDWACSTAESFSGNYSITESPSGNYSIFQTSEIVNINSFDLTSASHAALNFRTKYNLENNYDYVQCFASSDNGSTWVPLCGRHTAVGSDDEDTGQPVWHGIQSDWLFEEISLDDFIGQVIKIRFSFFSDQSNTRDGFYFDDFRLVVSDDVSAHPIIRNTIDAFTVMPCPANAYVKMIPPYFPVKAEISDITGRVIQTFTIQSKDFLFDVSTWCKGVYYVRSVNEPWFNSKFVVN